MKDKYVLAFDIGSSKIRAMLAGRGLNNTFNIKSYKEIEYDGFYEGEFLNKDNISSVFNEVIDQFEINASKTKKVYISVPAEFSSVVTTEVSTALGSRRRVKKSDVDSLYYMASEKSKNAEAEVVNVSAISFSLDNRFTLEPVGEVGSNLSAKLSIIYASKLFIEMFNDIVAECGFSAVEYVSDSLAQARYIVPKENKEDLTLLVDSGDITTSIAFIKGDGVIALTSFSRGGGFITNDLSEAFELSMDEADKLKKQIVLSVKGSVNDCYHISTDNGVTKKIGLNDANEVVSYRLDELAEVIIKCVQLNTEKYPNYMPVYLTGAGISKIKGGRDYLAKCLGRNISYGTPSNPGMEKPEQASILSLIDYALNQE